MDYKADKLSLAVELLYVLLSSSDTDISEYCRLQTCGKIRSTFSNYWTLYACILPTKANKEKPEVTCWCHGESVMLQAKKSPCIFSPGWYEGMVCTECRHQFDTALKKEIQRNNNKHKEGRQFNNGTLLIKVKCSSNVGCNRSQAFQIFRQVTS